MLFRSARSARKENAPVTIDVVVERELLVLLDIALSEDAHAHLAPDGPFGNEAVGVARVVEESTFAAALGRVDELVASACVSSGSGTERREERTMSLSKAIK